MYKLNLIRAPLSGLRALFCAVWLYVTSISVKSRVAGRFVDWFIVTKCGTKTWTTTPLLFTNTSPRTAIPIGAIIAINLILIALRNANGVTFIPVISNYPCHCWYTKVFLRAIVFVVSTWAFHWRIIATSYTTIDFRAQPMSCRWTVSKSQRYQHQKSQRNHHSCRQYLIPYKNIKQDMLRIVVSQDKRLKVIWLQWQYLPVQIWYLVDESWCRILHQLRISMVTPSLICDCT